MDINTWNSLTTVEQNEIKQMGSGFTKMVLNSNSSDGRDFIMKHEVRCEGENYFIFDKSTNTKFGNFKSTCKKVMEALMTDAGQNYGR